MRSDEETTDPRGTIPPPEPPEQMDPAKEFAVVVSNMLDSKLSPISEKLDFLQHAYSRSTDKINEQDERLRALEGSKRREVSVAWFALLLALFTFGGLVATFIQLQNLSVLAAFALERFNLR